MYVVDGTSLEGTVMSLISTVPALPMMTDVPPAISARIASFGWHTTEDDDRLMHGVMSSWR